MDVDSNENIKLIEVNGNVYIWDCKDWLRIRKLRILGSFVGNLASPQKNDRKTGLPLSLLKEETTLLLEKEFATLKSFSNSSLLKPPNENLLQRNLVYRQELLKKQVEILKNKRKIEIESKIDVILAGKKAKLKNSSNLEIIKDVNKEDVLLEEYKKIQPPKESSLVIQINTKDPWVQDEDTENFSWNYPREQKERLQYYTFKDLWEKGYYITPGTKFGGDYLVYPGDPVKFHAFFIILCVKSDEKMDMSQIISYGRLGQSVKKTVVLAYFESKNKIAYSSLKWAGF